MDSLTPIKELAPVVGVTLILGGVIFYNTREFTNTIKNIMDRVSAMQKETEETNRKVQEIHAKANKDKDEMLERMMKDFRTSIDKLAAITQRHGNK